MISAVEPPVEPPGVSAQDTKSGWGLGKEMEQVKYGGGWWSGGMNLRET